jgi:hypothetical protein
MMQYILAQTEFCAMRLLLPIGLLLIATACSSDSSYQRGYVISKAHDGAVEQAEEDRLDD